MDAAILTSPGEVAMTEVHPREGAAQSTHRRPGEKPRRNPYLVTIAVVWISALVFGLLLFVRSSSQDAVGSSQDLLTVGTVSIIIAGVVALVHLAIKAILWREGDGDR